VLETKISTEEQQKKCALRYRLHLPIDGELKGLVLMVHGRAGSLDSKWVFGRAFSRPGFAIVAPEAPLVDDLGGFSWWKIGSDNIESKKGATDKDLEVGIDHLENFLTNFLELYPELQGKPIIASGFSQGAGLLSTLSLEKPELFSAVSLLCGFLPAFVYEKSYQGQPLPKYFIFHGTEDKIITLEKAEKYKAFLEAQGADVSYQQDSVGHKVSSAGIKALAEWLKSI